MVPVAWSPAEQALVEAAVARGLVTPVHAEHARRRCVALRQQGQPCGLLATLAALVPERMADLQRLAASPGPWSAPASSSSGAAWGPAATPSSASGVGPGWGPSPSSSEGGFAQQPTPPAGQRQNPASDAHRRPVPQPTPPGGASRSGIPQAGDRVGPYAVVKELGRGGMGAVYVADHVEARRRVALKVRLPSSDARGARRFVIEAQAAARVRHPNVVTVHDVGEDEAGRQWMAMDLVEGEGLDRRLSKGGPLDPREAARITLALARALEHAHGLGVLHRDIKPANVLLRSDGVPLLTDFGLAKVVEGGDGLTRTGEVMGSPNYMPPEQASGDKARIGPRADIWSLGATLYHMLAGRPPFQGPSVVSVLAAVIKGEVRPPSSDHDGVPAGLEAIVLRAMQRDQGRRYQTMTAMAEDLERYLGDLETAAAAQDRTERRDRALKVGLVGAAVAGPVLAFGLFALLWTPAPPPRPPQTERPPPPPTERATEATTARPPPPTEPPAPTEAPVRPEDAFVQEAWVPARDLESAPPPRWSHGMAYDAKRRLVVVVGGRDQRGALDDQWAWDGARWRQEELSPRPPARFGHAMAWDAARGCVVLHGGMTVQKTARGEVERPTQDDTWELDGGKWTERSSPGPGVRAQHGLVFDPKRRRAVLFGGLDRAGRPQADLWGWSGQAWSQLPIGPRVGPVGRTLPATTWDAARDRLIVFGGLAERPAGEQAMGELWEWSPDGGWEQKAATGPRPRRAGVLVAAGRKIVLFAGAAHNERLCDTWLWDGQRWDARLGDFPPEVLPFSRSHHGLAWDADRGKVVLFGGFPPDPRPMLSTWEYRPPR